MTAIDSAKIDHYVELLLFWNRRINITAVRDPDEVRTRHFDDSLAAEPHVPTHARTLVDVGSGGGFPGAVLALARPELQVTLVESNHKKAAFLEAVRREIPVPNLTIRSERVETLLKSMPTTTTTSTTPTTPDRFDVAVSRATFAIPEWLAIGAELVVPGGTVLGFEGSQQHELPTGAVRMRYAPARALIVYVPRGT